MNDDDLRPLLQRAKKFYSREDEVGYVIRELVAELAHLRSLLRSGASQLAEKAAEDDDDHTRGGKWGNPQADLPRRNDGDT